MQHPQGQLLHCTCYPLDVSEDLKHPQAATPHERNAVQPVLTTLTTAMLPTHLDNQLILCCLKRLEAINTGRAGAQVQPVDANLLQDLGLQSSE